MSSTTGFKFRAYPSGQVAGVLHRWIGCQRYIYNAKVTEDRYHRSVSRTMPREGVNSKGQIIDLDVEYGPIDQAYAHLIGDGGWGGVPLLFPKEGVSTWLREVPAQLLRNGAVLWNGAYRRFFKKLGGRPQTKSRRGEQSLWLTGEMFSFVPVPRSDSGMNSSKWRLLIGTKKHPVGEMPFKVHGAKGARWKPPASIHITLHAGRWHVSFCNEVLDGFAPTEQGNLDQLRKFTAVELTERTVGLDRGVEIPLMATGAAGGVVGKVFGFLEKQKLRMARKEVQRKRWQRKAARCVKGSKNQRKAYAKAAKCQLYGADVRKDFAHKVSRELVDSNALLFVFEALKVKNMTASAAGSVEEPGRNVRQKAGLNRSILGSAWGDMKVFTKYKAQAAGKLVVEVPAHHSSQECSACSHTHAGNRTSQSRFLCLRCGHAENADSNAGRVIAHRGVWAIVSGSYSLKAKKTVALKRRPALEPGQSEQDEQDFPGAVRSRSGIVPAMPVEVGEESRNTFRAPQLLLMQETPATALA